MTTNGDEARRAALCAQLLRDVPTDDLERYVAVPTQVGSIDNLPLVLFCCEQLGKRGYRVLGPEESP